MSLTLSVHIVMADLLLASLAAFHSAADAAGPVPVAEPFVRVVDGKFRVGAQEYRAMGFTAYELNIGKDQRKNPREKVERVFRVAKEHGFTLFRAHEA